MMTDVTEIYRALLNDRKENGAFIIFMDQKFGRDKTEFLATVHELSIHFRKLIDCTQCGYCCVVCVVCSQALYHMAKSRWEIENQGFNDGKNRYGLEHICHHHPNSLLINWLIIALTLTLERLYRNRYLHRGNHGVLEPVNLVRLLWISLGRPPDSS